MTSSPPAPASGCSSGPQAPIIPELLNLKTIIRDPDLQTRASVNDEVIKEYQEALAKDILFPPITVFKDPESGSYRVVDGHHRLLAAGNLGREDIWAEVHHGNKREALFFATKVNVHHGLRRTNLDKRRAVTFLLKDAEWSKFSDRVIANHVGVSHVMVGKVREELNPTGNGYQSPPDRIAANGIVMKVPVRQPAVMDMNEDASETAADMDALTSMDSMVLRSGDALGEAEGLAPKDHHTCGVANTPYLAPDHTSAAREGKRHSPESLRSIVISVLQVGIKPCGMEEDELNELDESELISFIRDRLLSQLEDTTRSPAKKPKKSVQSLTSQDTVPADYNPTEEMRTQAIALYDKQNGIQRLDVFRESGLKANQLETASADLLERYIAVAARILKIADPLRKNAT